MNPYHADVFVESFLHLQLHHQQRGLAQVTGQPANDRAFLDSHLVDCDPQFGQAIAVGGVCQQTSE